MSGASGQVSGVMMILFSSIALVRVLHWKENTSSAPDGQQRDDDLPAAAAAGQSVKPLSCCAPGEAVSTRDHDSPVHRSDEWLLPGETRLPVGVPKPQNLAGWLCLLSSLLWAQSSDCQVIMYADDYKRNRNHNHNASIT